ncbi:MFS transporter [Paenibacillus agricola]|uniref:Multidrug efflux MFS transporter n=1 Tax=Paenibacillus agricola TaxID=2716264 RepID=A0ABX0JFM8_9BACL|nr:MFS transporter [Paenibacillus agricola]NHN34069.1 multidrug efflux MFS transporter [Paenibacillus agricola]
MEIWQKNLWVLWFGTFVASASLTMVIPFLPLFLIDIGVNENTEMWAGLLFSSTFMAAAISSPFLGSLADKYGRKKMIIRAGFVLFIVFTLTSLVTNPYQLLALRIFHGLMAGYIPAVIALIGTNTPDNKVGYALTTISTATASGRIMGPLLGGGIAHLFDNRAAFAFAGILVLLSTLSVIFLVKEEKFAISGTRSSVFESFKLAASNRTFSMVLMVSCIVSISVMTVEPVLSLYIVELGGAAKNTSLLAGFVFSLVGITGILFATSWGKLADRIGFRSVLIIGLAGGAIGSFAQIFFHDIWGFSIVRFIYGAFFCAVIPAINGLVVRSTPSDFRGRAFGLNNTANQLGSMIGPMIGGLIGGMFSTHGIFVGTAVLLMVAIFLAQSISESKAASPIVANSEPKKELASKV